MKLFPEGSTIEGGDVVYDRPTLLGPRIQSHLQLVYVHQGEMSVTVDRKSHALAEGEAILLIPGGQELFQFARNAPTHHGWCQVCFPNYEVAVLDKLRKVQPVLNLSELMKTLIGTFPPFILSRTDETTRQIFRNLVESVILDHLARAGFFEGSDPMMPAPLQRACNLAHSQLQAPLTLDQLAKASGVSQTHLIRLFRNHFQQTPIEWLWQLRLRHGKSLLEQSGLKIEEIAYRCGFQNPYHFSRRFKNEFRHSPRAHRNLHWEK